MNRKSILTAGLILMTLVLSMSSVYANSAQTRWSGTDSTGAIVLDEDSPIIVEKELLTFDINEFPQSYYRDMNDFVAYSAKVTAEYTFYNPSDYTITATLAFPFGGTADYADLYDHELNKRLLNVDTEKYDVTIDGQAIEKQIRHTLMYYGGQFELEEDLLKLHDGFMKDDFYSPELSVYKYTYSPRNVDLDKHPAASAAVKLTGDNPQTKLYMENQSGGRTLEDGILLETWVERNDQFSVYIIGKPLKDELEWTFYHNGACEEEISGTMLLVGYEEMTFKDLALSYYQEDSGILDYDWYNAIVTSLKANEWSNGVIHTFDFNLDVSNTLMRWYQYEITLEPQQRVVNAVTAPMYPAINSDYEPPIFKYTYLLSPAKTWKEFGNLDIVINTPYYLIESNQDFLYNNPGYEVHLTGLSEGELVFTLCSDSNPVAPVYSKSYLPFIMVAGTFLSVVALVFFVFSIAKRKRSLKRDVE
ncbi:MAG: hypothetical protein IJ356_06015 [Erysipelotrichaceae bacterium]|nr:hypothetical protein [Erysipelotrichaceae bacterium]